MGVSAEAVISSAHPYRIRRLYWTIGSGRGRHRQNFVAMLVFGVYHVSASSDTFWFEGAITRTPEQRSAGSTGAFS